MISAAPMRGDWYHQHFGTDPEGLRLLVFDGPYGPAHKVKKGVLHLALQSGIPIVPLTISVSRFIPVPSWDCKKLPLPFSRIKVIVHQATHVNEQNFPETISRIVGALGA